MSPKVEVSGVSDLGGEFEPLPVGNYPAKVTKCDVEMSKANKPKIAWNFTITGGEFEGRLVFHNTSLQPQAAWRLVQELEALDVPHEVVGEKPNIQVTFDSDDCAGRVCQLSVGHRQGDKGIFNTVEAVLPF